MRPLIKFVLLVLGAGGMFLAGALTAEIVLHRDRNDIARDKDALRVILADCDYSPHPISDVSWELYRQRLIPLGTAGYYTRIMKSVNIPAVECLLKRLPEQWVAPGDG